MEKLIDTYLSNYVTYENGKISFECTIGELIFIKDTDKNNMLILFSIYIHPEYRKNGVCRAILQYLIDNSGNQFTYICVQSVLSNILYEYLVRFHYKNKKFKNTKNGFVYKI
jgi:hypothetical protein